VSPCNYLTKHKSDTVGSTELFSPIGASITSLMRTQGLYQFAEDGLKDPFEHAFGCTLWDFFATNEEHKTGFDLYMAARRPAFQKSWFEVYPAARKLAEMPALEDDNVMLVDVGGGHGHEVAGFAKAFPNVKGRMVLQDLQATLESLKLSNGIETMAHDFFQPQPVKGKLVLRVPHIDGANQVQALVSTISVK